jgi:hypothetical protein
MSKRVFVLIALVVAASMVLSACGGAPAAECTDALGCVNIGPNDPIHIISSGGCRPERPLR